MSATGRGPRGGGGVDFFPTPSAPVKRIMDRLPLPLGGMYLEPTAGDGAIVRASGVPRERWTAVELRAECRVALEEVATTVIIGDFAQVDLAARFDVALLNPPFTVALPIIDRCLLVADWVVALLRLNWLGSKGRAEWLRRHAPDVYILDERPSFTGDGSTDATEYAWYSWPPGKHDRARGVLEVLPNMSAQRELFGGAAR